jgi:8-oxo-dGTP pyrophosphatase MutT (NUDIX family)
VTGAIPWGAASHAHVVPRPAATVVLFRDAPGTDGEAELLLTRRPSTMAFGPDLHVFPGGAVETPDADGAPDDDPWQIARIAAARELHEEAGIDVDPATLVPLSLWTTPPIMPRRYATRFFGAWLPRGAEPRFDPREVVDHAWLTPTLALDAMADGDIDLWIPTSSTLQQVQGVRGPDDIAPRFAARVPASRPRYARDDATLARIEATGAGGITGRRAVGWLVGRERLVLVDHGDPAEDVADLVIEAVVDRGAHLEAIVLTSPDPEHSGGAEALALRLGIPVFGLTGARRRLPHEIRELRDGATVPCGDVPLTATSVDRAMPGAGTYRLADGRALPTA